MGLTFSQEVLLALLGAGATVLAVGATIWYDRHKTGIHQRQQVRAICQAIRTEITCVMDRYKSTMGETVENHDPSRPFTSIYIVENDYFSIFHSNSDRIGEIEDEKVRNAIVTAYVQMKGLADTYKFHNHLVEKYVAFTHNSAQVFLSKVPDDGFFDRFKRLSIEHDNALQMNFTAIQESHQKALGRSQEAVDLLTRYIATH